MFREWLQIARSQTAAAIIILCGIFYLMGDGDLFSWYGLALIIFSILIHDFSFAHNSVIDVLTGYDTKDKFKDHFPLCAEKFNPLTALKISHVGLFITTLFAILLAFFGSGNSFLAISFYSIFLMCGFWYNEWTSKIALWDFIPISLCFTSLSVYAFFLASNRFTALVILSSIYIFLVEWYEIGIAGEIKECEMKEEISLLRYLGMTYDEKTNIFDMNKVALYPFAIKIISILLILVILSYSCTYSTIFITIAFGSLILVFNFRLTQRQYRDRNKALRDMAIGEILAIFLLPLVLYPLIGLSEVIVLLVFSLAYFVLMNQINWKSWFRPQV